MRSLDYYLIYINLSFGIREDDDSIIGQQVETEGIGLCSNMSGSGMPVACNLLVEYLPWYN